MIYRDAKRDTPNVLICSGLDPSGGAGFIADVRVVSALGGRPVGVVTALTVQNTVAVQQALSVEADSVGAQLASLLGDVEVHAVKIGLIGSVQTAREISYGLDLTAAPVVWDPVGAPSRGRVPFDAADFDEMLKVLAPHLRLLTPNVNELGVFAKRVITNQGLAVAAAREIIEQVGELHVLVKGGHWNDGDLSVDLLVGKHSIERLEGPRIGEEDVHGTGCALSSAIATQIALGKDLVEACREAKAFVATQLSAAVRPGRGAPAVV